MTHLYKDIPNAEYHDNKSLSRSDALTVLKAGPATAKYNREHREEGYSPALKFGTQFHTAMEGLDEFHRKYGMEADGDRRTVAYKDAMKRMRAESPDKEFIKREDHAALVAMADKIRTHSQYKTWIGKEPIREASLFGTVDQLSIKARPDLINLTHNMVVDWKTTTDGSLHGFSKSVSNFGYWLQPAWYGALLEDYFGHPFQFVFVCVEKHPPYNVSWYELSDTWLRYAKQRMTEALTLWRHAANTNEWRAYSEHCQTISAPQYVRENVL